MNTGETPFTQGWPVLVTAVLLLVPKRPSYLKPGAPVECQMKLLLQWASLGQHRQSSLSGSSVLVDWPLGTEVSSSGFRQLLVKVAAGVAPRRLAVAMCSQLTC